MDYWIDNYCKVNLKANTASTYKKKIDLYIKPAIGSYYLKDIEPSLLQELINNLFNTGIQETLSAMLRVFLPSHLPMQRLLQDLLMMILLLLFLFRFQEQRQRLKQKRK